MSEPKIKVAVLGGGVGAMTTALYLTSPENRDRYEVTVYQMGWRLGGKGASGRNRHHHDRIEEHGIHVWSGLYDNAFRHMREAYAELGRPPDAPLGTWRKAFEPMTLMCMMERHGEDWRPWLEETPTNDQLPGDPDAHVLLPFWSYIGEALQMVRQRARGAAVAKHRRDRRERGFPGRVLATLVHLVVLCVVQLLGAVIWVAFGAARILHRILAALGLGGPVAALAHAAGGLLAGLLGLLARLHWRRVRRHLDDDEVRRGWLAMNFGVGLVRGLHADDIVRRGFDVVDHLDFRDWLARHVVDDGGLTVGSPLARFLYDADFAYEDGDMTRPRLSASTALNTLVRLAVSWKGAVIWSMQAGMGDTVFTPFYQVLRRRGVRFEFFRKVTGLHLTEDGSEIGSVTVARQACLAKDRDRYEPLCRVKDLDCWPSEPLWEQLADGEALQKAGVDFEDWCAPVVDEEPLELGVHFDRVVLGISLGAHPYLCRELMDADPAWRSMVQEMGTVRTLSTQLWLSGTDQELGWPHEHCNAISTYDVSAFDSWAGMARLVDREGWPKGPDGRPGTIAYVGGPMKDPEPLRGRPQSCAELDQDHHDAEVRRRAKAYLSDPVFRIYPKAKTPEGFDWRLLVDDREPPGRGEARFDAQFFRANVQPTERYVLSLPGTVRHRLHPGDSGFDNLVLAGDWTWNALNVGCVEAATISGMLAAHALCGSPALSEIVGLTFGHPDSRYRVDR